MKSNNWSLQTRFLHIGLVLTVTVQLFISLVMTAPDHTGTPISTLAFDMHQVFGLAALGIVLLHWAWSIFSRADGGLKHLFPVSKQARQQVFAEISDLKSGKFPETGKKGGFVGLIHGLGLLAVTGVAITGGFLFVLFPETGEPGALAESFAELHEGVAALVWAYWIGHAGMALLHHYSGHDVVKKMFSLQTKEREEDKYEGKHKGQEDHLSAQPVTIRKR